MALRAVVVGGGLGGMAAAVALAQAGIGVRVYEQARRLTEVGAGVSLAPNGLRVLERFGVGEGIGRMGARYASTQLLLSDGRPVRYEPHQFVQPGRNVGIHRADLLGLLAGRLPPGTVRTGHRCTGFSQDGGSATVGFADGATATADAHRPTLDLRLRRVGRSHCIHLSLVPRAPAGVGSPEMSHGRLYSGGEILRFVFGRANWFKRLYIRKSGL